MGKANLHVFFLLFLILSSFCESNDQLTQANSLSPVDMLISEGRVFALGFFSPTNSSKSLYLGIWHHNIPERTVVWVANRDSPISNHSSVKLTITNSSEMVLFDSEGRPVWKTANTATAGGADGAVAVLLDSGNFLLQLLRGIDHPTDTVLPGTRLLLSYKAQEVGRLVAWKGPDDPSSGDFSLVRKKNSLLKMLLPIIACVLLVGFGTLVWTCKSRGKRRKKKVQKRMMLDYLSSMDEAGGKNIEFPLISFENIVAATDNFSNRNMLGQGAFGKVYKGMLEGTKEVAVKRLSNGSGQGTEEFRNVVLIAKLQHKNLVKLIGCCIHEDEKLLVYEYLPNKSLDYFLFDATRKSVLQWPTRFKVIQGVARGIMYLHQDSKLTIIHRDLKASNILLDKEMSPKISDFGMARIFCGDQLQANTNRVVGTYGYMPPEYAMEGAFSVKSDTYSFGVLMLEIAWNYWKDGKIEDLVDSSMVEDCSLDEVSRCINVALLCVQDSPNCRPLMSAVVFMLENNTTPLPTPKQPVYFVRDYEPRKASDNMEASINDASLTTLQPTGPLDALFSRRLGRPPLRAQTTPELFIVKLHTGY